ncbi:MAG TPA: hypothetical protein VGN81_09480 [Pseudonocardiaceae bacterium]|jgi:hypothetical protein
MDERPISVGELLRREGQQSESHDSQARRALGGVAVGAVLAFGAVVGGLVLHNAGATPSDMPVAGGGTAGGAGFNGSVPIASTGTIGSHHSPQVQPAANTTATNPGTVQHNNTPNGANGNALGGAASNSVAQTTDPQSYPSSSGTLPSSTGSSSTSTTTGSTSTSTGSTTTSHNSGGGSTTGTSSSNPSTSTGSTTTSANSGGGSGSGSNGGGGLLGAVGSTLGSVTQPVFNWFGGN